MEYKRASYRKSEGLLLYTLRFPTVYTKAPYCMESSVLLYMIRVPVVCEKPPSNQSSSIHFKSDQFSIKNQSNDEL